MKRAPGPFPAAPGEEEVERIICASLVTNLQSVYAQMETIRKSAMRNNPPMGVRAVLLFQSGWFIYWVEGRRATLTGLIERVRHDTRHHSMRVVHHSRGRRLLPTAWSMILSTCRESVLEFGRRVAKLRLGMDQGNQLSPTSVFRQLMVPMLLPEAQGMPDPEAYYRVGVCASSGMTAFEFADWLGDRYKQKKTHRRFAGESDLDSGSAHVEFMLDEHPCRVIAVSRQNLLHGVRRAFLPDWPHLVLLFNGDGKRDTTLMETVCEAFQGLPNSPTLLAFAPDIASHARMAAMALGAHIAYLDAGVAPPHDCEAIWHAVRDHLDHFGPPSTSLWTVPDSQWAA